MSNSGSLQESLAAMGFSELALAFVALAGYSLVLNGSIGANARWIAGAFFALASAGFAALTSPWTNGIILVAIGIAGIGAFVAAAWALSAACGFRGERRPPAEFANPEAANAEPSAAAPLGQAQHPVARSPAHSA
jgi:hypothetical protein